MSVEWVERNETKGKEVNIYCIIKNNFFLLFSATLSQVISLAINKQFI